MVIVSQGAADVFTDGRSIGFIAASLQGYNDSGL
jgi:hypothetical protein